MKRKKNNYKNRIETHNQASNENRLYALKRIDVILMILASGGIFIVFEILKVKTNSPTDESNPYLVFSAATFLTSIAFNILALWSGYFANKYEIEWCDIEIEILKSEKKGIELNRLEQKKIDNLVKFFSWSTSFLNGFSTVLLLAGMILTFYATYIIFLVEC
jgi:hypothetical protein